MESFKISRYLTVAVMAAILFVNTALATLVVYGKSDPKVLVGKNMDCANPGGRIWFIPGGEGNYGAVYIGLEEDDPQSGFNEAGLFCAVVDCPHWQTETTPGKEVLFGNLIEEIMTSCASVDDALALWEKYNIYDLHYAQIMVADKSGKKILIEGDSRFGAENEYLLMSNFYQSNPKLGGTGQESLELAEDYLDRNGISFENLLQLLSATRREIETPTIYSFLGDLKKGQIYIYNFHDFVSPEIISIKKELAKGKRSVAIQDLFGERLPYKNDYIKFVREADIRNDLRSGDIAIAANKIITWFQEDNGFDMHNQGSLNNLGYQLMGAGNIEGAIIIFELNVDMHPEASNPYDSLGEAYMNAGRMAEAIVNYRKSLELDPGNTNAADMIKRLENPE